MIVEASVCFGVPLTALYVRQVGPVRLVAIVGMKFVALAHAMKTARQSYRERLVESRGWIDSEFPRSG